MEKIVWDTLLDVSLMSALKVRFKRLMELAQHVKIIHILVKKLDHVKLILVITIFRFF
jgi:hypothetical protein